MGALQQAATPSFGKGQRPFSKDMLEEGFMEQQELDSALDSAIEAILFALGSPVTTDKLAPGAEADGEAVRAACRRLAEGYENRGAGIRLIALDDSWQLVSAPQWAEAVERTRARKGPDKLSPAALETLTLVAYFQPITRAKLDQMRGVDSAHSLSLLLDRELVEPKGRLEAPGRPTLYGTTPAFLRAFGLERLADLPPLPPQAEGGAP
jgi:segregation and condensation protein B